LRRWGGYGGGELPTRPQTGDPLPQREAKPGLSARGHRCWQYQFWSRFLPRRGRHLSQVPSALPLSLRNDGHGAGRGTGPGGRCRIQTGHDRRRHLGIAAPNATLKLKTAHNRQLLASQKEEHQERAMMAENFGKTVAEPVKESEKLDYHALNAMLNLYDENGQIQFDADHKAANQFFLQHVNQNTVFFHNLAEKLEYLVENKYYDKEILDKYDFPFIK